MLEIVAVRDLPTGHKGGLLKWSYIEVHTEGGSYRGWITNSHVYILGCYCLGSHRLLYFQMFWQMAAMMVSLLVYYQWRETIRTYGDLLNPKKWNLRCMPECSNEWEAVGKGGSCEAGFGHYNMAEGSHCGIRCGSCGEGCGGGGQCRGGQCRGGKCSSSCGLVAASDSWPKHRALGA